MIRNDDRSGDASRRTFAALDLLERALVYPAAIPRPLWTFPICGLLLLPATVIAYVPLWALYGMETVRAIYLVSLVPGILPLGYFVLVIRAASYGEEDPPPFRLSEWEELLVLGSKATVIYVIFFLYPQTVFRSLGLAGGPPGQAVVEILTDSLGSFASEMVTFVVFMYVYPAAVMNFARDGRLRDGLNPSLVVSTITNRQYALGAAIAASLVLANSWILGAIFLVDLQYVGPDTVSAPALALVGFLTFYLGTSLNYVVGRTYAEVSGHERTQDRDTDDVSAETARQLEVLAHLHDRGLLGDEEYRSKRGAVLGRLTVDPAETAVVDRYRDLYRLHSAGLLTDEEFERKTRTLLANGAGSPHGPAGTGSDTGAADRSADPGNEAAVRRLHETGVLSGADVERARRRTPGADGASDRPTGEGTPTPTERLDALETLRSAGLLTNEEFDEKRRALFDLE